MAAVAVYQFALPAIAFCNLRQGFVVDLQDRERSPVAAFVLETQVRLAEVAPGGLLSSKLGKAGRVGADAQVERVRDELAAWREQFAHAPQKSRQVGKPADFVQAVAEADDRVETATVELIEVGHFRAAHAPLSRDHDAFRRNVDRRDLDPPALQFERMKASAGADVEDAPTAQIESQRFERINRLPQQKAAGTSSRAPS
jgi:hypothetical protein